MVEFTEEEKRKMIQHRDAFINFVLNSNKDFKLQDIEAGIEWLYSKVNLSKPLIFIADSYIREKLMANYVFYKNMSFKDGRLSMNKNRSWEDQISKVNDRKLLNMTTKEWNKTEDIVEDQLRNQLDNGRIKQDAPQNPEYKLQFVEQGFGLGFESWIASYEYFKDILNIKDEDYRKYVALLKNGIWSIQYFRDYVFITKLPKKVTKDNNNRLHSVEPEGAVQWKDGYRNYFIHGVSFDHDLYQKVIAKKLPAREILKLQNIEQRYISLEIYGAENLLQELDAKQIDKSRRGNELYEIHGLIRNRNGDSTGQIVKLMKYVDPSTGRVYASFVPPEVTDADAGMAWKFKVTTPEYERILAEA